MKLFCITIETPTGFTETFVLNELLMLKKLGVELFIAPRSPSRNVFHQNGKNLLDETHIVQLINPMILFVALYFTMRNLVSVCKISREILFDSRSLKISLKNLAVLPKALYFSEIVSKSKVDHIHAYWGSTTSTMAYVISKLTGIPWSFSLYRWDITENNLLKKKVNSAAFTRCTTKLGRKKLFEMADVKDKHKVHIIHMGVNVTSTRKEANRREEFVVATPANLIPVKGHKYLIDACLLLVKKATREFRFCFYGEGQSRKELEKYVEVKELQNGFIEFRGQISQEKLMNMYMNGFVGAVVLPSINTSDGEHEGTPAALIEAMACGVPVVSTKTGAIPELLGGGSGVIVEEKNPNQLANALLRIMDDSAFRERLSKKGFKKVQRKFNLKKTVPDLLHLIKSKER